MRLATSRCWIELQERILLIFVKLHDGGLISAPIAVVGCTKYRDDIAIVAPVVAFHDQLVRPRNEAQPIRSVKLLGNILAKGITGAAGADAPTTAIVGIRPQQVTHGALVRNLLHTIETPNLIECVNRRR